MNILTSEDVDSITAASNNVTLMVSFLNEKGLGILNLFDNLGRTMLHLVIGGSGNVACVQLLLEKRADPNAVSGIDDQCSTPLHYAARAGNLGCIDALLKHGGNIDMRNSKGKLAIELAEDNGSTACIEYLKDMYARREKEEELKKAEALYRSVNNCDFNGAKQALDSMKSSCTIVNEYCYDGNETLLNNAVRLGKRNIVMLLIHNKADGLQRNKETRETSLYIACCNGHSDIVELLVQEFPKLLDMPCDKEQIYPLHAAILYCKEPIVEYLLTLRNGIREEKADQVKKKKNRSLNDSSALSLQSNNYFVNINQPMASGLKPLHLAVSQKNKNILLMLLACKPFIQDIEVEKYPNCLILDSKFKTKTPLHLALENGCVEIAELLLENGADYNIPFMDSDISCTPLQYICRNEKIELLELLLKHKAEDYNGISLKEAMENDRDKVVNLLLSNGILLNIEGTLKLTSNDFEDKLTPISIYWKKRFISYLKEKWILAAPLNIHSNLNNGINNELLSQLITDVNLSDNNLESVPFLLFQLPSLKKLNLSNNKLAELPCSTKEYTFSQISRDKNFTCLSLEELELQHNELTVLPDYIFQMYNLLSINCSHNKVHKLPFEMWLSESLQVLILHHNCLSQLPVLVTNENFERKKNNEKVADGVDDRLFRFQLAKEIFLYSRKLIWEDVFINIQTKQPNSGLIQLDLSHNKFFEVPDGIACLAPNLFDLNLSHNEISDISYISAFPKHISHLKLAKNNIEKLDFSEIQKQNINCYAYLENTYSTFEKGICQHRQHTQLVDLVYLDISGNKLSSINFFTSFNHNDKISQTHLFCENLSSLNISNTLLKCLPDGIENLGKLNSLFFTQNSNIDDLLLELLNYMTYDDNMILPQLSQSIKAGCERNLNIKSLQRAEEAKEFFPNIKLMLVGPQKVGKTTLLNSLRKEGKGSYQQMNYLGHYYDRVKGSSVSTNTLATVGVDVSDWTYTYEKKSVKFSTWDFAGEHNYSVTHHFFLCQEAVYLLVWQLTNEPHNKMGTLKTWLHMIQTHAPGSAVIIVRINIDNKVLPSVPPEKIKKKFVSKTNGGGIDNPSDVGLPNVIDYIEVDCNKSQSIKILCDLIAKTAMTLKDNSNVSVLEQTFPDSYQALEKAVFVVADRMKVEKNRFLDDTSFRLQMYELLDLQNVELRLGVEEIDEAVQFLHKFGSVLHFKTSALNGIYFVDPQWLCDILAFIITIVSPEKNGLIEISDIERSVILEKFSISTCIDLLNRFDIAVELSSKTLFIPSLLPDKQPDCSTHSELYQTYLQNEVFRRQYIMSYVPCGFWAMLIKRIRSDSHIYEALLSCCNLKPSASSQVPETQQSLDSLKKFLKWSCWKTGIEISFFGFKLLRICKLDAGVAFYGSSSLSIPIIVLNPATDLSNQVVLEITVPIITLNIGKNQQVESGNDDYEVSQINDHNMDNFHVIGITHVNHQTACRLFVIAIEHIDNLMSEWFPQLDNHISSCGVKNVRRVSFCNLCLESAIEGQKISSKHKSELSLFEFEQVLSCLKKTEDLVCPSHENDVLDIKMMFPDLFFLDVNIQFIFDYGKVECDRLITRGEFGDVFSVTVALEGSYVKAAMKVPGNHIIEENRVMLINTDTYLTYRVFREELTTILPIEHERIIKYKGVSFKPIAMFFELAPQGSLSSFLDKFKERKKEIPSHIVTQTLQQVSDAINYLDSLGILYYNLKSENILVREFPEPDQPGNVQLLLAYFGTSQKMCIGMRGFKGKPGYVAPDVYFHKENCKSKVLSFLFGSFVYELINLRQPFGKNSNSYFVNKFILEGKQPKLSIMARQYPISVLSLLRQCWAVNSDDRPTSLEIKTLTSLKEFTSLLDVIALNENFHLQCVKTSEPKFCNRNVVSSQSLIGSHIWLVNSRKNQYSIRQETIVTVFSYKDFQYTHEINFQLKEKIVVACLVGNNMWLGTDESSFKVYCTLRYEMVAYGEKINHACILCILHCPLIKRVFFTLSDGNVLVYSDDVRSPSRINAPESSDYNLHPITKIVRLTPLHSFSACSPIHCICIFKSNPAKKEKIVIEKDPDISLDDSCLTPDKYELWCGQEKGILQILDVDADSFKKLETLPVHGGKASSGLDPINHTVTFLETNRFFVSDNQNKKFSSSNVWMVVFPGTEVQRWNVNLRVVEGVFDTRRYDESHTVNSANMQKIKVTKVDQSQIQSLVIVENKMYVGTSFGLLFTCDAYTMIPYTWVKCYNEYVNIIVPFRMVSSCHDISQRKKELILTCGRKILDDWLPKVRENNQSKKKRSENLSFALMTWSDDSDF